MLFILLILFIMFNNDIHEHRYIHIMLIILYIFFYRNLCSIRRRIVRSHTVRRW